MKAIQLNKPRIIAWAIVISFQPPVQAITPVLDGYAYELYDDIIIDTNNHIINIDSNMVNCEQPNGDPPLDTVLYALYNTSQFIGIRQFTYNTNIQTVFFTSETGNLLCDNGVYVDTIYAGSFE